MPTIGRCLKHDLPNLTTHICSVTGRQCPAPWETMEREEERLHRAVGKRLLELREQQEGLTQERLAERSGLHVSFVARVERGETAATVDSLAALCSALGVTLAEFFEKLDKPYRVQGPRRVLSKE